MQAFSYLVLSDDGRAESGANRPRTRAEIVPRAIRRPSVITERGPTARVSRMVIVRPISTAGSTGTSSSSVGLHGDIILFGDRRIGIVESVMADGSLVTVEGNSSHAVSRVTRQPGEATGFVRLQ